MCICAGIWNKGVATSCRAIFSFCLAPFFECAKMYKCNCCAWAVLWTILRIFALKYNIAPVCENIHIWPDIYDGTLIFMTFSRWQLECLSKCPPDSDSNSHYVRFTNGYSLAAFVNFPAGLFPGCSWLSAIFPANREWGRRTSVCHGSLAIQYLFSARLLVSGRNARGGDGLTSDPLVCGPDWSPGGRHLEKGHGRGGHSRMMCVCAHCFILSLNYISIWPLKAFGSESLINSAGPLVGQLEWRYMPVASAPNRY